MTTWTVVPDVEDGSSLSSQVQVTAVTRSRSSQASFEGESDNDSPFSDVSESSVEGLQGENDVSDEL